MKSIRLLGLTTALVCAATLSCAFQGDYPAPSLGVVVDSQFTVLDVKAGSAAARAGIEVGDVLVSLDGTAWPTPDEWQAALSQIENGQEYIVVVQRGTLTVSLNMTARRPAAPLFPEAVTPTPIPAGQSYF
jgi:S1-C subfamily serine protease